MLAYHGRRGLITFTIIKVAPAFIGLHDRAVILVSANALPLLKKEEFAALVAHEIGHDTSGPITGAQYSGTTKRAFASSSSGAMVSRC